MIYFICTIHKDSINMNTIESKYYNIKQTRALFKKTSSKGFSIFSCITRSLPKNLCLLNDILVMVKESSSPYQKLELSVVMSIIYPFLDMKLSAMLPKQMRAVSEFIKRPDLEIIIIIIIIYKFI